MQPASAGIQECASVTVALMISYGERVPKEREGRKEGRKEKSVVVALFSMTVLKGPGQVPPAHGHSCPLCLALQVVGGRRNRRSGAEFWVSLACKE